MAIVQICDRIDCTACGLCHQVCPKTAIRLAGDEEGFAYPIVDESCIECGLCISRCPANHETKSSMAEFYMGWNRDPQILKCSSSGGIYTALAHTILGDGGVVFGVAKAKDGTLLHIAARNEDELATQRCSKYYQANVDNAFIEVQRFLSEEICVLFSGTACQIAGLKSYLGRDYDNLLTVDVLCHGVASKRVVDSYLADKARILGEDIADFRFRSKAGKRGWRHSSRVQLDLADKRSVFPDRYGFDTFFLGFNAGLFLRESCYRCRYAGLSRVSDITLGDYWGCLDERVPEAQNNLGVSLVLCNTSRGATALEAAAEEAVFYEIEAAAAVPHNHALMKPSKRPAARNDFFNEMEHKGFDRAVRARLRWVVARRRVRAFAKSILPGNIVQMLHVHK